MDRINTPTKALDLFGPGKHGFKDGDLSLGIQPTDLDAAFFNDLQEELVGVIEGAGLAPTPGVRTQLRQAISLMIAGSTGDDHKGSVRVATTANIASLNGGAPNALDGVALAANNRILVKDQATPSQNGLYYVATLGTGADGIWLRALDADGADEMTPGMLVTVEEGTAQADTLWLLTTDGPITIGTTAVQFARRDSGAANTAQITSGSVTVDSNALTATLDPSTTDFRSTTSTSGARISVTSSSALSLVVPTGASLGLPAGQLGRIYVLEINNAGVKEPAIVYSTGGINLDENGTISTTAISGISNSPNVVYSQTARASVAYRVRMYFDISEAVAGTWASPPTLVQPVGGQAGAALQSLGYGQNWQDMAGSRALSTNYTNTTGRPIMVSVQTGSDSNVAGYYDVSLVVNGVLADQHKEYFATQLGRMNVQGIVPPGGVYYVASGLGITGWKEMR